MTDTTITDENTDLETPHELGRLKRPNSGCIGLVSTLGEVFEDFRASAGIWGGVVSCCLPMVMVAERSGRSVVRIFLIDSPVRFCASREMARAANTTSKPAADGRSRKSSEPYNPSNTSPSGSATKNSKPNPQSPNAPPTCCDHWGTK